MAYEGGWLLATGGLQLASDFSLFPKFAVRRIGHSLFV